MKNIPVLFFFVGIFVLFPFLNFSSTLDPETVWRIVAMSILVLPYLFYYFFKVFKGEKNVFPFLNNRIIIFLSLFIIVSSLSLIKAINPGDGLFDVLKLFLYLTVVLITSQFITESKKNLDIMIWSVNISVIIFGVFGFIQLIHLYNESKDFNQAFVIGQSLKSSLGNKNSYAEVLLLSFPFCLYGAMEYRSGWKLLCAFTSLLVLLSIFIVMNLYVWLALGVSVILVLLFMIKVGEWRNFFKNKKTTVTVSVVVLVIIFCISGLFFMKSGNAKAIRAKLAHTINYIKHPGTIGEHQPSVNDNNIHERLMLVKNTVKMIKANWALGVGVSNWKIYEPTYGRTSITSNIRVDYPHNDYLSVFAETGIIGVICYMLFLFFAMRKAIKIYKHTNERKLKILSLLMLGGILGFAIVSFFGFAKEKFFPMIFLMMMIAILVSIDNKENEQGLRIRKIVLLLFIPIIILLAGVGIKRISSEMHLQKALKAKKFKQWKEMMTESEKADSYFYPVDYSATSIQWYKGMAYFYEDKIDSALKYLVAAEPLNPYHVQLLNDIGTCYELKSDHDMAIKYYESAFDLDPYLVRENLAATYFNAGQLDKALDLSTEAKFDKTVFLEEILTAKAMKFHSGFKGDKDALLLKIQTKGWLMNAFERSKAQKKPFEVVIGGEI